MVFQLLAPDLLKIALHFVVGRLKSVSHLSFWNNRLLSLFSTFLIEEGEMEGGGWRREGRMNR